MINDKQNLTNPKPHLTEIFKIITQLEVLDVTVATRRTNPTRPQHTQKQKVQFLPTYRSSLNHIRQDHISSGGNPLDDTPQCPRPRPSGAGIRRNSISTQKMRPN